jgi:Arc/MetJ-type ribon-helix-helix transcriptional regulator
MERMEVRVPLEQQHAIDLWRAAQKGLPSRAEAVRQLVGLGLKMERVFAAEPEADRPARKKRR